MAKSTARLSGKTLGAESMRGITVKAFLPLPSTADDLTAKIAAELQRAGGEIQDVNTDQVVFRGTTPGPSWKKLSGIGDATLRRTNVGIDVELSFPGIIPLAALAAVAMEAAVLLRFLPWNMLVLLAAFFPLVAYLSVRERTRAVLSLIRSVAGA